MKISEEIEHWGVANPGRPFFSFEFFPPKTNAGLSNLYDRFDRLATLNPLWIDVTWGAGGSTAEKTLEICESALKFHGLQPLMHLTCTNMSKELIDTTLERCRASGIRNILALRGDPPAGEVKWTAVEGGYEHASDLVRYIRTTHGDFFCIVVAGYPEGHLENPSPDEDLLHLKEKLDAGADLVITQLFYDTKIFQNFVKKARDIGITAPILPGIMPIQSYAGFKKMTFLCKTHVPAKTLEELEKIKDDEQSVKDFGVEQAVLMCQDLLAQGVKGLHFYTLNLEVSVSRIVDALNISTGYRTLPWRPVPGENGRRRIENVRPIFWSNRPRSYLHRTAAWDDFPNGRWGDRASPAYGEPFYSMSINPDERSIGLKTQMWGDSVTSLEDVKKVFKSYLKGKIEKLPWCNEGLSEETKLVHKALVQLVEQGVLTINSQPRVNAALSTDAIFGWGPKSGFVYQKAYVEFFCTPETLKRLLGVLERQSELTYAATSTKGNFFTNAEHSATAVTWGVFPAQEIVQPTIVDNDSFLAWKDEAFMLWKTEWASIYPEGSDSKKFIEEICASWYLVNIVDNNFVSGDLFGKLSSFLGC